MKGWLIKGKEEEENVKDEMGMEVVTAGAKGKGKVKKEESKPERWLVVVGTYSVGKERIVKSQSFVPLTPLSLIVRRNRYRHITRDENLRGPEEDEALQSARRPSPQLSPHSRPTPRSSPRPLPLLDHKRTPRPVPQSISTSPRRIHEAHRIATYRMDISTGEGCGGRDDWYGIGEGANEDSESGGNDSAEG